ncbi:hypothetical protein [Halolamina sp.]|jgi:hypothetical protein|nr:hypothetical protein Halar_2705 [halophilic archaeon DL31]
MGLDEEIDALAARIERTIEEWEQRAKERDDEFADTPFDTTELEFGKSI